MDRKELANNIMHACDIMRSDGGTSGVLAYMEQLSWLIFLKIFEDIEKRLEEEAKLAENEYQPIIAQKYRWSSWARKDWRGNELIEFIDKELFPYLRSLTGSDERRTISTIFTEISGNRMKSGFNLRDVIGEIDKIDFNNPEDSHVVSQVYEDLLLKMGKEGGLAGEFYTPRPIVRLIVKIINPKIGETILDPFCGSGGFLAESFIWMKESKEITVNDYELLQRWSFFGQEKMPLPYLLGIMNCILHGLLTPNIVRKNTLENDIRHIPESERLHIVMTNPPFGGKEGQQIQQNFPVQSQSTEILALQFVMKKLKVNGRCGIVVPESLLNRGDSFAQVKKELIENFNLHTIISLAPGVFANVTPSGQGPKTDLLFFDKTGPTKDIWFYEQLPPKNKRYSKANMIIDEDLKDCFEKFQKRSISSNSWIVSINQIDKDNCDLSPKNPTISKQDELRSPEELVNRVIEREKNILEKTMELKALLSGQDGKSN